MTASQITQTPEATKELQSFSVRLKRDLYERLRAFAFATRQSMNETVSHALDVYLAEHQAEELSAFMTRFREEHGGALEKLKDD